MSLPTDIEDYLRNSINDLSSGRPEAQSGGTISTVVTENFIKVVNSIIISAIPTTILIMTANFSVVPSSSYSRIGNSITFTPALNKANVTIKYKI